MAYNGAKTTHTLAGKMFGSLYSARSYEEPSCRTVTYNGSKPSLIIMPGYGEKAGAKQPAGSRHKEVRTPDTNSRYGEGTSDAAGVVPSESLKREPNGLQRWTLRPMAQEKQLVMAYPDTPNHPKQAYKTNPDWSAK